MIIQEAIRSGKPFRRKGWPDDDQWAMANPGDFGFRYASDPDLGFDVTVDDILANDWETKP